MELAIPPSVRKNIKRGDAAVFIAKALELDFENSKSQGFTDLNDRVAKYVNAVAEAGIASGKTSTSSDPNANITCQEMARMLANAYDLTATTDATFIDVSDRWIGYVSALKGNGITYGKNEYSFGFTDYLTREEFALFIHRAELLTTLPEYPDDPVFIQRMEEIQAKWQQLKPTYDGPVLEKTPSVTAPYGLGSP